MAQTQASATQQVAFIEKRLLQLYTQREDAQTTVTNAEKEITSLRNVLAGMPIGQLLAAEIAAEQKASTPPTP